LQSTVLLAASLYDQ